MMKKILLLLLCVFLLSSCSKERKYYEAVEKRALSWYEEKYSLKGVEIVSSFKAGNSGLFGYIGVDDRAYETSDGYYIYWDDSEEIFYDSRQAAKINEAFDEEVLLPLISQLDTEVNVSEHSLNRTGMESFDECVFRNLYDGDIFSFLEEEKPELYRCTVTLKEKEGFDHEGWTASLNESLEPYLSGYMAVCIVREDASVETERFWLRISDPDIVSYADLYFSRGIRWFRQVYIQIAEGVYVCSDKGDFVLEEAGKAIELQQILDEAYYAMPVDAEENAKGGYMVHDQRHEKRVVLNDTDIPYYRLKLSERVIDALDSDQRLSVYFRNDREGNEGFYVHYGYGTTGHYELFSVAKPGETEHDTLHPDNLYYFGSYEAEAYPEE